MKKIEFCSYKGLAGEFKLKGIDDVMSFTPFYYSYSAEAGSEESFVKVFAVLENGSKIELRQKIDQEYGCNYDKPYRQEEKTIGEQIAGLPVKALIFHRYECKTYGNFEDMDFQEILYLQAPDYKKIRRRLEDRLRKSGDDEIFRLAVLAGVKIY